MAETAELAIELAKLSTNQQEIIRRLDAADEARRRDREEDQRFHLMLQDSNTRITRLEERNAFLMKLIWGGIGAGTVGLGHAGIQGIQFLTHVGG